MACVFNRNTCSIVRRVSNNTAQPYRLSDTAAACQVWMSAKNKDDQGGRLYQYMICRAFIRICGTELEAKGLSKIDECGVQLHHDLESRLTTRSPNTGKEEVLRQNSKG